MAGSPPCGGHSSGRRGRPRAPTRSASRAAASKPGRPRPARREAAGDVAHLDALDPHHRPGRAYDVEADMGVEDALVPDEIDPGRASRPMTAAISQMPPWPGPERRPRLGRPRHPAALRAARPGGDPRPRQRPAQRLDPRRHLDEAAGEAAAPRPCSAAAQPRRSCAARGKGRSPRRRARAGRSPPPPRSGPPACRRRGTSRRALGEGRRHQVELGPGVEVHGTLAAASGAMPRPWRSSAVRRPRPASTRRLTDR